MRCSTEVDAIVCPTSPSVAFTDGIARRPALDVHVRRRHAAGEPRGHAGDLGAVRVRRRAPGRPAGDRAAVRGRARPPGGARVRAGDRVPHRALAVRERGRMTATATIAAALDRYEVVIGLEVHAQLLTRSKMFCPCPADYTERRPEREHLPGVPRASRRAADDQPAGGGVHGADRARAATATSRRSPSSTARTTSTRTCPRAIRSRSTTCRCRVNGHLEFPVDGETRSLRHHARPPRGGHGHDAPRRRRAPERDVVADRPQPLRRAAHGDRRRAGPAHARGRARVSGAPAPDPHVHRRQRRQPREGLLPLRRQRLAPAARRSTSSASRSRSRT